MIIRYGQYQTIVPQRRLSAHVEGAARLPTQIRIIVARFAHRHNRRSVDGDNVGRHHASYGIVGRDARQISRFTIADAKFQAIHGIDAAQEGFVLHIPLARNRREETPRVILPYQRATVGAHADGKGIAIENAVASRKKSGE